MMQFLLILELVKASSLRFHKEVAGPQVVIVHKFAMYSLGDVYGSEVPYINAEWSPSSGSTLVGILDPSELVSLYNKSTVCSSSIKSEHLVSITEASISRKIKSKGVYSLVLFVCEKELLIDINTESINPYGHLAGEYIPLLPFYGGLSALYLVLLIVWAINLCVYYEFSIYLQKYWIPLILLLCILEHILNFWDWGYANMQGNRNFLLLLGAVLTKAIRDSFGRVLLMGAAKGWGIIHEEISSGVWIIVTSGILYFFFDIAYEVIIRVHEGIPLWMLLLVSLPLIVLNTLVFYFVFAWFSQVFYTLNLLKQLYKLRLLKQFAFVLGIAGTISIIWTIVDTLARVFLNKENTWQWMWLYIGIWDIIFLLLVISLMIIWRINKNSKLLATSQEIRSDDNELSYEEEEKYGVELAKVK